MDQCGVTVFGVGVATCNIDAEDGQRGYRKEGRKEGDMIAPVGEVALVPEGERMKADERYWNLEDSPIAAEVAAAAAEAKAAG